MQPIPVAAAAVAGLVIGYVICLVMQKGKINALQQDLDSTRKDAQRIKRGAEADLKKAQDKLDAADKEGTQLKAKVAGLTKDLEQRIAEVQALKTNLGQSEASRSQVKQQMDSYKRNLEEAQRVKTESEAAVGEAQKRSESLERQVRMAEQEMKSLRQLLERRSKEIQRSRKPPTGKHGTVDDTAELFTQASSESLDGILKVLVDSERLQVAVLADSNGIVVAAAGDNGLKDGVAATSQLVDSLTRQLEGMVPFDQLKAFYLQDHKSRVIAGRAFDFSGETVGLATFGSRLPSDKVLDTALNNITILLG